MHIFYLDVPAFFCFVCATSDHIDGQIIGLCNAVNECRDDTRESFPADVE